jgi:AcrR family transcriptional regulator
MRKTDLRRDRELRRREGYRENVVRAAERVILRKGYSALTMDDVAREAQLSKATIYKYVPGKGALLSEILGHSFDALRDKVAAVVDGPGTAAEKLGGIVQAVLQSQEDTKHFHRVLWMDKAMFRLLRVFAPPSGKAGAQAPGDRKMLAMLKQKREELVGLGARVLEEGIASGEFRRLETRQAASFIEAVLQGYTHMRFWEGDAPLQPAASERLARFIIEGIRNPERSGKEY